MSVHIDLESRDIQDNTTTAEREAFVRGVEVLDRENPDWSVFVDLATLAMADTRLCVMGQVYGSWIRGANALGLTDEHHMLSHWGFDGADDISFLGLNYLWRAEVAARQTPSPEFDTPTLGEA